MYQRRINIDAIILLLHNINVDNLYEYGTWAYKKKGGN